MCLHYICIYVKTAGNCGIRARDYVGHLVKNSIIHIHMFPWLFKIKYAKGDTSSDSFISASLRLRVECLRFSFYSLVMRAFGKGC